ncbi:MAG: phage portal protein, partial [Candidatus Methylomirabilis sp.]|nr:phage portal protein [Deltaproteobacteria bacterium]
MSERFTGPAPILLGGRGGAPSLAFQMSERAERYRRSWAYYEMKDYDAEELAEKGLFEATRADGAALDQARRIFATAAFVVDKNVRTLFQRRLDLRAEDPRAKSALDSVWRENKFQQLKYRIGRFGGVTGDVFLEPIREDGRVRIELYDSEAVDVDYDPARGGAVRAATIGFRNGEPFENREWEEYVRVLTPEGVETYFDGKLDPERSGPHGLGRVPLVHIRNLDLGYFYGRPSFHAILPALDQLNSMLSRVLAIADRYANPHLVATGCDASGLSHELDRVWTVHNEHGDLRFLEYKGDVLPALL